MTCLECSNPVTEGASLCTFCGAPIAAKPSAESTEAEVAKPFTSGFLGKLMHKGEGVKEGENLCLWNPLFVAVWCLPILGIWIATPLIALNWRNLGRKGWAAWTWLYLLLHFIVMGVLLPDNLDAILIVAGDFAVWLLLVALPQVWFVQTYYPVSYERRRWLVPIGLGLILSFALPKVVSYLNDWADSMEATTPSQLSAVAQAKHPVKELTVEEVVQLKTCLVVPVEITWEESSWVIFKSKMKSSGSAVFFCTSGNEIVFITNRHVIDTPVGAQNITRRIVDGKKTYSFDVVSGKVVGIDLALIRLTVAERFDEHCIPYVPLDQVAVGQECVAIGNTLGGGISVTTGIVSKFDDFGTYTAIRTSAPISPGNSGGALFRRKDGALIGITTSGIDENHAQNVNFAIPVECLGKLKLINPSAQ